MNKLRFVEVNGIIYLRMEDVVSYIVEVAATEETDVRFRLNQAVINLLNHQVLAATEPKST